MKRYYMTEYMLTQVQPVRGISPKGTIVSELPKLRGKWLHQVAEDMFYGREWHQQLAKAVQLLPDEWREQQHALVRRAMLGWQIVRGSWYQMHFVPISAEKEWTWHMGHGVYEPLRMDQIIRRKDDQHLGILDFKTKSSVDANWVEKMKYDDQTLLYVQALKDKAQEDYILGIVYEGILIGKLKDGWQQTPFVMGYQSKATGKVSPKYSAQTEKVSLVSWSDEDWLKWIQSHGMLQELYTTTGFCNPSAQELARHQQSTALAEVAWQRKVEQADAMLALYGPESPQYLDAMMRFEKNGEACLKFGWDYACGYYPMCRQGKSAEGFIPREDHHSEEGNE